MTHKIGTKAHKEEKWKEAIEVLNDTVNTKLAPSEIHGVGVFALRDIKKGEKMYQNTIPNLYDLPYSKFNKLRPEVKDILLQFFSFKTIEKDATFWYPVNSMQAYINHSENPNYEPYKDIALKDIKAGEEILENYKTMTGWEKVYKWLKS